MLQLVITSGVSPSSSKARLFQSDWSSLSDPEYPLELEWRIRSNEEGLTVADFKLVRIKGVVLDWQSQYTSPSKITVLLPIDMMPWNFSKKSTCQQQNKITFFMNVTLPTKVTYNLVLLKQFQFSKFFQNLINFCQQNCHFS